MERITDLATLHLGPNHILVAITLAAPVKGLDLDFLEGLERALKRAEPRVRDVLFRYVTNHPAGPRSAERASA